MHDRRRHIRLGRLLLAVLAVLAVGVVWAGLAWACTPRALLDALDAVTGPQGTEITVGGRELPPGGRVEVRLDSPAGPLLGTSSVDESGRFSNLKIRIPDLPPDVYGVIAFGYSPEGSLEGASPPRVFEIVPNGGDGGPPQPEPTEQTAPGGDAGSGSGLPRGNIVAPGERGAPVREGGPTSPGQGDTGNSPRGGTPAPGTGTTRSPRGWAATPSGSPTTSRSGASNRPNKGESASNQPDTSTSGSGGAALTRRADEASRNAGGSGLVTAPSGQPFFRDSLPSPALTDGRRSFGHTSGHSASGDLWSGFESGRIPWLEQRRIDPGAEDGGFDLGLAAGTGFLGIGLVALFGSFLVAEVRRHRKARASVNAPRR
jgi:hypothetical protein